MRTVLFLTLLLSGMASAQYPSAAGIPFSPTQPFSVPNVTQRPANGGFTSGYYYGYGQYGYGYPAYGYGNYPGTYNNPYNSGSGWSNSSNYNQSYTGYNGRVGSQYTPTGQQNWQNDAPGTRSFPSASSESSLHRGW